ncbi:MAG TPA: ThuA domain-containing protein [Actinomycetes bacterium]|nr:ThuA domain-containing protein [Actinomycetes bacterium]
MGAGPRRRAAAALAALTLALAGTGCGEGSRPPDRTAPPETAAPAATGGGPFRVLVFTRTAGFRHRSIEDGVAAIRRLGQQHGFGVDDTADATRIGQGLAAYRAVVFLSTTGEVLDGGQQAALQRYLRGGGGWVGVHAAADAEYHWPWYGGLVGAWFRRHPAVQRAVVLTEPAAGATEPAAGAPAGALPRRWERTDEWYDFRTNPRGRVRVLATLDESTYSGGGMGGDHPIAWCHRYDGGRAWYTAMGHTSESFQEPLYLVHLLAGIRYAAGAGGTRCGPGG